MAHWSIVLLFVVSALALSSGGSRVTRDVYFQPMTYQLVKPAVMLVDTGRGLVATQLHPQLPLRIDDPTSSVVCKHIKRGGHSVFFVPSSYLTKFFKYSQVNPFLTTSGNKPHEHIITAANDNSPHMFFLRPENIRALPKGLRRVFIQSSSPSNSWRVQAYMPVESSAEEDLDYDLPEEVLSAPAPIFPALCVSPEKPKPIPVLYAPATHSSSLPSTASLSLTDLSPVDVSRPSVHPKLLLPVPQALPLSYHKLERPVIPTGISLTFKTSGNDL